MTYKAWIYEAGYHCAKCAKKKFKDLSKDHIDKEGNEVIPVSGHELNHIQEFSCCDTCLGEF